MESSPHNLLFIVGRMIFGETLTFINPIDDLMYIMMKKLMIMKLLETDFKLWLEIFLHLDIWNFLKVF